MPTVSPADLTLLRTTRHATLLSLWVYHPASIWTARVNGAQTTGDTTVVVDGVVQTVAPRKNYLVKIGSTSGGNEYGTARYKSYSAPTLTLGTHNCALPDDAYVTIVEEIKPTAIHVSISATDVVSEDGNTAYTNENVQYMPLAKIGPPAVAYIDASTGLATVNFYSSSQAFGGALASYAWTFPSGTPATSAAAGTSGAPIAVTWNTAGEYYVRMTVTDANGKTHTHYIPVFIHNEANPPYRKIEVSGLSGDVDGGSWACSIKVMESDASVTEFPEQALCVLSAEDWYGSTKQSIGGRYTYRENIVFVGYIRKGTITKNPFTGYVEFDLESVSGVMDNIWELASTLTNTSGTPGCWHTLKNMTHTLAAHHILTQHSTITEIADCYFNVAPYQCNSASLNDASLLGQLRDACCNPVRSRAGCSAQGMFYLEGNPQILEVSGRPTTDILDTTFSDIREIDFGDELQEKQTSQIDFSGENILQDPIFSLAPATPWQSGSSEKVDGIRVVNQAEANIVSGLYEGYRNNSFADVVITWRGNYRVFDVFPSEYLRVTIAANQNARGIVWTNQKCWIKNVSMEYAPGILTVSTTIEKDVVGALGATGNYPPTPPTEPTPSYPPTQPSFPPAPPPDVPPGDGSRTYVATDKGVARSDNFLDASPTWATVNTGLSGDGLDVYRFMFDPWSAAGGTIAGGYVATKNGIYKNTGLPNGTWNSVLSTAQVEALIGTNAGGAISHFTREIVLPINVEDYIGIVCKRSLATPGLNRNYYVYSTDGGTTWNANTTNTWDIGDVTGNSWNLVSTDGVVPSFAFPSHTVANKLYISLIYFGANPFGGTGWIVVASTDGGATLARVHSAGYQNNGSPGYIILPFANSSGTPYGNDLKAWRCHQERGSGTTQELQYTTTFPLPNDLSPDWTDTTLSLPTNYHSWLMDFCTWNENYIYLITSGLNVKNTIYSTNNGGTTWQSVVPANAANIQSISALPYNPLFCAFGGIDALNAAHIWMTQDGGATIPDHSGDLNAVLASISSVRSIVADWVKVA